MRRRWWVVGGVVVALPVLAAGAAQTLLNGEALRTRLEAAVTEATGRRFTLSGPVSLKLSLVPTVVLDGPSLANAPGGSRPAMLAAQRVEAEVALLPLLQRRIDVRRLVLEAPDLLVESDRDGRLNWRLSRPPAGTAAATPPANLAQGAPAQPAPGHVTPGQATPGQATSGQATPAQPASDRATPGQPAPTARATIPAAGGGSAWEVVLHEVVLRDGHATWHDARNGRDEALALPVLDLSTDAENATLRATGTVVARNLALRLDARGGTLAALLHPAPGGTWPIEADLSAEGLDATLNGALAETSWNAHLAVTADRLDRLSPALPGAALPEARDLALGADLSPAGIAEARLTAASLDLRGWVPELRLTDVSFYAPRGNAAIAASGAAVLHALPLSWNASLPPADQLRGGPAPAGWPLQLSINGDDLALSAEGTVAGPRLDGAALRLNARVNDLGRLGSLAGRPLPGLRDVTASARLDTAEGWLRLDDLALHAAQLQGGGSLRFRPGAVPAVGAELRFSDLDLDTIAPPAPAVALPAAPAETQAAPPQAPAAPQPPALPAARPGRRVIPDVPLPFDRLRRVEADATLAVTRLRAGGIDWRDGAATLSLHDGRLRASPVTVNGAGGPLSLDLTADGSASPGAVAIRLAAPSLDLGAVTAAAALPGGVSGTLEAEAALTARGNSLAELAATLDGPLGLALANGRIDLRLLDRFGGDLRRLLLPNAPANGSEALRCFALRLQAAEGVARAQAMLLETDIASVLGSGLVDLRQERLDLRLLPRARIGGLGLTLPVIVDGAMAAPRLRPDGGGAAAAGAAILQDLAGDRPPAPEEAGCAAQLRIARGGRDGPVPEPAAGGRASTSMGDLLRGLLTR
ncbi:AsmA family protein [Roseomonas elaeocarpi]|uniref:AsmA family protein n=1 Tax=Roseomonas elaeocarpi TaxID=907779 RepID=A0ABV6JTJ5_9PROT